MPLKGLRKEENLHYSLLTTGHQVGEAGKANDRPPSRPTTLTPSSRPAQTLLIQRKARYGENNIRLLIFSKKKIGHTKAS